MALQVDGDVLVALCELWKNRPEHLARHKATVQQDERGPGAVSFVVELDAVDLSISAGALHVRRPIGFHTCAPSAVILMRTEYKTPSVTRIHRTAFTRC